MADTLQFDLVSPERKLASLEATSVQIPGMAGDFTAMPQHAPFLTTLRPGVVKVIAAGETTEFVVTGGFAEVSPTATTILAEYATPRPRSMPELSPTSSRRPRAISRKPPPETRMAAGQRVRDVIALQSQLAH